jgi:hypothetical protein
MQELINKVTAAAGISEEQAKQSIAAVSDYLKGKLPEPFRGQIDNLVNGGSLSAGVKAQLNEVATDVREKAEDLIDDVREKAEEMAGKIRGMFSDKKEDPKS